MSLHPHTHLHLHLSTSISRYPHPEVAIYIFGTFLTQQPREDAGEAHWRLRRRPLLIVLPPQ